MSMLRSECHDADVEDANDHEYMYRCKECGHVCGIYREDQQPKKDKKKCDTPS